MEETFLPVDLLDPQIYLTAKLLKIDCWKMKFLLGLPIFRGGCPLSFRKTHILGLKYQVAIGLLIRNSWMDLLLFWGGWGLGSQPI